MLNRRRFMESSLAAGSLGLMSSNSAMAAKADRGLDATIPKYNLPSDHLPRIVQIKAEYEPYEVHVDPIRFYLYWTLPDNIAIRYTTGVGKGNLYHPGEYYVATKKEWPRWIPTPDMLIRQPDLYTPVIDGMPGGLDNPLGARALYLYTKEKGDSFLRLHGTNDPLTIGGGVTNGCARLMNDQIIDLFDRVTAGTRVVLSPKIDAAPVHS